MREITERQAQPLNFIESFILKNGYSPTVREIAEYFKTSIRATQDHILALAKKDCITYQAGKSRTIRLKAKKQGVTP